MTNPTNEPPRDADVSSRKPRNERSDGESTTAGGLLQSFNRLPQGVQTTIKTIGFVAALVTVWFLSRVSTPPMPVATVPVTSTDGSQQEYAERLALAKSRREQALALGNGIESHLKELDESIGKWSGVQDLLRNEEGKRVAGNPQFVSAFSALLEAPRATHDQANALRQAYRALIEPIEATHKTTQASYLPGDNSFKEFARLQESILQALEPYRRDLASVEAMRATARQQNQPAPYALADVIAREHERAALHTAEVVANREAAARQEADQGLAEASAERIRAQAEKQAQAIRSEALQIQGQTQRDKLLAMAKDEAVQARFRPFLIKGKLGGPGNYPGPLSVTFMERNSALDSLEHFAQAGAGMRLGTAGGANSTWLGNDRPPWVYPTTEQEWNDMRERFELFKQLRDIWIELKVLSP